MVTTLTSVCHRTAEQQRSSKEQLADLAKSLLVTSKLCRPRMAHMLPASARWLLANNMEINRQQHQHTCTQDSLRYAQLPTTSGSTTCAGLLLLEAAERNIGWLEHGLCCGHITHKCLIKLEASLKPLRVLESRYHTSFRVARA